MAGGLNTRLNTFVAQNFWPIVPIDLVENRQRSRIAACFLVLAIFIPIFTFSNVGYEPLWPSAESLTYEAAMNEENYNISLPIEVTQAFKSFAVLCAKEVSTRNTVATEIARNARTHAVRTPHARTSARTRANAHARTHARTRTSLARHLLLCTCVIAV